MKNVFYTIAALSALLTGCLKDEGYDDNKTGFHANNSERSVTILNAYEVNGIKTIGIFTTPVEESLEGFVVALAGPVAGKDIQVDLSVTPALVDAYNTENSGEYEVLPAAAFELPPSVTIPAGKDYANVRLKLKKGPLDPTKTYAVGVQLSGANDPAVKVAGNTKQFLIGILVKNSYDGVYELRAATQHPTNAALAGPVGPTEIELETNGVTSVITSTRHPWANGSGSGLPEGYNTIFTVNPATNKVTVTDGNGIGFMNSPGYDSRYDPASRTIYAKWQYVGSGGNRVFTDTLVFLRLRD
ncbi:MAG: DUF1735 domain-containing protein [Niastella sp.]|nr:DUF1735 domain-containing protein [Niastella sp.]